jgi:selenide, water dikinase
MTPTLPLTRDLVLIGGGHTHALILRMWGMNPVPGVRVTLINPGPYAAYSGMLPGFIAGHYDRDALNIDLVRLARHAGARLVMARATGIDRAARRIILSEGPSIAYDVASVDIGISSAMPAIPGFADHAVPAKPLDAFADHWAAFLGRNLPGPKITVIGAGIAGCELALAAAHRLGPAATVTLIEAAEPLALAGPGARQAILSHLARARIALIPNAAATHLTAEGAHLSDGRLIPADLTIGAAGTRPAGWLADTGLTLTEGFLTVSPTLQTSDPAIFACGDIAHMTGSPRPKAGVFAVRQAPVLLHNLTATLTGQGTLRPYRPQCDYLKLISTGDRNAIADKWGLRLDGALLWRWKDHIDRRFMGRLNDLPPMPTEPLPTRRALGVTEELHGGQPLCGGCGAKIGQSDLAAALSGLPPPQRPEILTGLGDDAAVLSIGGTRQVLTTDHLRAFTHDPVALTRIAAIHAMGDIWAMGATPQAALAQITLPRLSPRLSRETLREIMETAAATFRAEGADIVGGHTSVGDDLTVGFTVTGLLDRPAITHSGAQPGDVLILTKPLGTGVILAAEMVRLAVGADVAAAFASMSASSGPAAAILAQKATAMTDVTGFGLAGHLLNILTASGLSASLNLAALPVLPGADALAAKGIASTLAPANRASAAGRIDVPATPRAALLFDPQTAGGLLAAVPASQADAILERLRETAPRAAVIGHLSEGPPRITTA